MIVDDYGDKGDILSKTITKNTPGLLGNASKKTLI